MRRGFTLIELLVVVAIIGILSSVVISSINQARSKARDTKRISDVRQIQNALEMYFADNGYYPEYTGLNNRCNTNLTTASPAGKNSLAVLKSSGYIKEIPVDPLNSAGSTYHCYEYLGLGNLTSYPTISTWNCDGRLRTDYKYTLLFSLEKPSTGYPLATASYYTNCIHGDLK